MLSPFPQNFLSASCPPSACKHCCYFLFLRETQREAKPVPLLLRRASLSLLTPTPLTPCPPIPVFAGWTTSGSGTFLLINSCDAIK